MFSYKNAVEIDFSHLEKKDITLKTLGSDLKKFVIAVTTYRQL